MKVLHFFCAVLFVAVFSTITVRGQSNSGPTQKQEFNYKGNIATQWMNHITDWIREETLPPPPTLRIFAYTGLALYESQLPGMKDYQSIYTYFTGCKILTDKKIDYYPPACANASTAEMLRKLQYLKSHRNQIDSLELFFYDLYKKQTNSKQLEGSVNFGKQVADSIFEWSKTDGIFNTYPSYTVPVGQGLWEPSPGKQSYPVPAGPYLGLSRTFCKENITRSDPGAPPVFSTDTGSVFYRDALETMQSVKHLSHEDSVLVISWQNTRAGNTNPMTHMTMLLNDILEKENYSLQRSSIIYAKHGMAMFDAVIAVFKAKYKYNVLSPVTYFNKYLAESDWASFYFYNPYPSYPSNYQACTAASGFILENEIGKTYHFTDSSQAALYGSRTYDSIDELVNEVGKNRVVGGLDFRFSVVAGKVQGRKVGEAINGLPFKKHQ